MPVEAFKAMLLKWHSFYTAKETSPSANYKDSAFRDSPDMARTTRGFFTAKGSPDSTWYKSRPVAYLTTYVDWTKSYRFSATGIAVGNKFVVPDRDVMHAMLDAACVDFDEETAEFLLTEKGQALVAPFCVQKNITAGVGNA